MPQDHRLAVLVTCYNRIQITLPNIARLIDALDVSGGDYQIFLLDDASPDQTGAKVRAAFPQIIVIDGSGEFFWNRGMRHLHQIAQAQGSWSGFLLFNDDVEVDRGRVIEFREIWCRLNQEQPTTLVGATYSTARSVTTYAGYRLINRNRPFALQLIKPNGNLVEVDTFNANFVLIPGSTIARTDAFDPIYVHSFGDLDLGFQIGRLGERILLAPVHIGECEDRPAGSRSRHGLIKRLKKGLSGRDDPKQHAHFIWKHSPSHIIATLVIAGMFAKRLWVLCANKDHVYPGSEDSVD